MPYDKTKLKEILLQTDCRTLDDQGKIFPPSNHVFRLIANRMELCNSHIKPHHVYTIINDDRNGFRTLIEKTYQLNQKETKVMNDSDYSLGIDVSTDDSHNASDRPTKKFKLVLSARNWQDIAPKKIISSGRVYWKFQKGWADVISERICQQHKSVDCVFSFKNNMTTPTATATYYSTFVGYCTECKAQITGKLEKAPMADVDVIFACTIDDIHPDQHTGIKTRQLRGKRREKIASEMINEKKSAIVIRREMARRLKDFGGKSPPIIPKGDVLRKAKEQQLLKMYGLEFAFAPLNLLRDSRYGNHAGFIHSVGLLKFHCIYWTPEQEKIYTARVKKDPGAVMTIDATGSIGKRDHKNDPHIFLYQCMVVTKEGSVPVFQMVTGDQRSLQIANFLRIILAQGVPRPPIVVCDFGRALINAVAEILGSCSSLADYLDRCYAAVMQVETKMPTAYIRLDVSHVTAMVARWDCLKSTLNAGQQLYQRCISQAYQMSNFEELAYFLESVLIVCLSEFVGYTKDGIAVQSEIRMQVLDKTIEGVRCTSLKDDGEPRITDNDEDDYFSDAYSNSRNWKEWADDLYDSAKVIAKTCEGGSRPNGCFNPAFALRVTKQLLPFILLWTGIMRAHFGVGSTIATSSSVEAEFGDLKHRSFAAKLPMRIDLFVLQHLDHLDGKIKSASKPSDVENVIPVTISSTAGDSAISHQEKISQLSLKTDTRESSNEKLMTNSDAHTSVSLITSVAGEIETSCTKAVHVSDVTIPTLRIISDDENSQDSKKSINDVMSETSTDSLAGKCLRSSTPDECDSWNIQEDWRGKAATDMPVISKKKKHVHTERIKSPAQKRRKPTKLDKCPDWKYIQHVKYGKLPVFKNGNFCPPVSLGKYMLNVRNTCAFDAIFQIILSAIASNEEYLARLKDTENNIIQLAQHLVQNKRQITMASYKQRANILHELSLFNKEDFTQNIKRLDATCNVAHLAQYLFADVPSHKNTVSCPCGYGFDTQQILLSINVNVLLSEGFKAMQKAIDQGHSTKRLCRKCDSSIEDQIVYGPHIIIDTTILTDDTYTTRNESLRHTLNSIATTIELRDKIYRLSGLVHYLPGHYVAYVKSGLYWHEYDDLRPTRTIVRATKEVKPHLVVYMYAGNKC